MKRMRNDPCMLEEYDFSGGVCGKYAKRYAQGAVSVSQADPTKAKLMKEETKRWLAQVTEDMATAKDNLTLGHHAAASFHSQQCAEKALKAYLIETRGELRKTHDLVDLGTLAGMPSELLGRCEGLTLAYIETRYPDQFTEYRQADAERDVAIAEAVREWVTEKIS